MHIINGQLAIAAELVALAGLLVFLVSLGLKSGDRFTGLMAGLSLMGVYAYLVLNVDPNLRDPEQIELSRSVVVSMTKVYIFLGFMNLTGAAAWLYALAAITFSDVAFFHKKVHLIAAAILFAAIIAIYHYNSLLATATLLPLFAFGFHASAIRFIRAGKRWGRE